MLPYSVPCSFPIAQMLVVCIETKRLNMQFEVIDVVGCSFAGFSKCVLACRAACSSLHLWLQVKSVEVDCATDDYLECRKESPVRATDDTHGDIGPILLWGRAHAHLGSQDLESPLVFQYLSPEKCSRVGGRGV